MVARVREDPRLLGPAVAGAVLSTVATVAQVALLVAATSPATLTALVPPLIFAGSAAVAYGLLFAFRLTDSVTVSQAKTGDAFSFKAALRLAATLAIILLATAALRSWLGEKGLVVAAGMAGFADAHATSVSVAAQVAAGKISPRRMRTDTCGVHHQLHNQDCPCRGQRQQRICASGRARPHPCLGCSVDWASSPLRLMHPPRRRTFFRASREATSLHRRGGRHSFGGLGQPNLLPEITTGLTHSDRRVRMRCARVRGPLPLPGSL